jgi:tartrate-resistant acid phosphatase type 5
MMVNTIVSLLLVLAVSHVAAQQGTRNLEKPANPVNSFSFFFWGDWGENIPANQSLAEGNSGVDYEEALVAAQVTAYSKLYKPSFYVLLGDNFYNKGVTSTTDPLWNDYYENVYSDPATMVPWYPVFGNHDYYGQHNPQPEIDFYLEGRDSRWTFPDYQYTRIWKIPGSKKTIQIFFINTVTMCPESEYGTTDDKIPWPANPTKAYPNPNPTSNITDRLIAGPTVQWVERALNASTADWKIVAGHYHIYTSKLMLLNVVVMCFAWDLCLKIQSLCI